jgi:hypothetical protein
VVPPAGRSTRRRTLIPGAACAALLLAACTSPTTAPVPPRTAPATTATPAVAAPTAPPAAPSPEAPAAFERTLRLQGVTFRVTCPNASSVNDLTILPSGLANDDRPITQEVDGSVTGAEVADLNSDGSPEIYVSVQSAGSGSHGSLVAYSASKKRSLSMIRLPPVAEDPRVSKGYMGHDTFAIVGNRLVQRFPVYRPGDVNAAPTGGMRQLSYELVPGKAGWVLRLDKVQDT